MLFLTYNNVKYGNKIKEYFRDKIKNYPPNNLRKKYYIQLEDIKVHINPDNLDNKDINEKFINFY